MPHEVKITKRIPTEQDNYEEEHGIPQYYSTLELKKEVKERIIKEIFDELDAIKVERKEDKYDELCDSLEAQYEGDMESKLTQFNIHVHTTKEKVDEIVTSGAEAFLDSDPIYVVTPRPEFEREGGTEVTEAQTDFLDYKFDNTIAIRAPVKQAMKNAVLKFGGFLRATHELRREKRRREEVYQGK